LTTPPVQRCQSAGRSPPSSLSLKELAWHKQRRREKNFASLRHSGKKLLNLFITL
jgi:hypothetical protein